MSTLAAQRLAVALRKHGEDFIEQPESFDSHEAVAANILAADPGFADAAEMGLAFAAAVEALPEGAWVSVSGPYTSLDPTRYVAEARAPSPEWKPITVAGADGPTPTLALLALQSKLVAREVEG